MQKRRNRRHVRHTGGVLNNSRLLLALLVPVALVVLLLLLFRPSDQLLGTPEMMAMQSRGVLRVGVRTDVPGFAQDGAGLETALAREIAKRAFPGGDPDVTLELVPVTAYTALPKLGNGDIDLALAQQQDRGSSSYAYSGPYCVDSVRLCCLKGNEALSLGSRRVGLIEGSGAEAAWKAYEQKAENDQKHFYYASYPDLVAAIRRGEIDFIAAAGAQIPQLLDAGLSLHQQPIGSLGYVAVSAADTSAFALLADMTISELKKDGTLAGLVAEYGLAYTAVS